MVLIEIKAKTIEIMKNESAKSWDSPPHQLPKYETVNQLALANVGPIYGVTKKPDESWSHYRRRILKAARTLDTVNIQNAPNQRKREDE